MKDDDPVDLDEHRGMAADRNSKHPVSLQTSEAALQHLQEAVERLLEAAPVEIRSELAAKTQSLTQLFAATDDQSPRSLELMDHMLNDLTLLCNRAEPQS
jgi:hypothetical protein